MFRAAHICEQAGEEAARYPDPGGYRQEREQQSQAHASPAPRPAQVLSSHISLVVGSPVGCYSENMENLCID